MKYLRAKDLEENSVYIIYTMVTYKYCGIGQIRTIIPGKSMEYRTVAWNDCSSHEYPLEDWTKVPFTIMDMWRYLPCTDLGEALYG